MFYVPGTNYGLPTTDAPCCKNHGTRFTDDLEIILRQFSDLGNLNNNF